MNFVHIQWNLVSLKRKGQGFFLYELNIVRTKKCDFLWIFSMLYADLYDRINVACLTVPLYLGLGSVDIFKYIWHQVTNTHSVADIFDVF